MVLIETLWNVKYKRLRAIMVVTSINRNIVECKGIISSGTIRVLPVLIETLWNVKCFHHIFCNGCISRINRNIVECKVLHKQKSHDRHNRINRNIVECKAAKQIMAISTLLVLIETLWNVKISIPFKSHCDLFCINRNIVECKVS